MDDHASRLLKGVGGECIPYSIIIDRDSRDLCDWVSWQDEFLLPTQIKYLVGIGSDLERIPDIGLDTRLRTLQNRLKKRVLRRSGDTE